MDCDEFRIRMSLFLGGKLDRWDLERFVDHAIECTACEKCLLAMADESEGCATSAASAAAGVTPRRGR
jgi:predicted anti-sigma-YlaC factor YlaD